MILKVMNGRKNNNFRIEIVHLKTHKKFPNLTILFLRKKGEDNENLCILSKRGQKKFYNIHYYLK